jgi:hypothetical protein
MPALPEDATTCPVHTREPAHRLASPCRPGVTYRVVADDAVTVYKGRCAHAAAHVFYDLLGRGYDASQTVHERTPAATPRPARATLTTAA